MKRSLLIAFAFFFFIGMQAQTTVFSDDFESGTTQWTTTGTWGLTTSTSHTTSHSLTESPSGQYANSLNISATMTNGVNLSSSLSANLSFWAKYDIEAGFDYMYVEISPNGGSTWNNVATFDDTLSTWTQFSYSLGGYVGNSNVKIRFRFFSDGGWVQDGMYIDDFIITSDTVDNAAPLVLHTAATHYQGTLGANTLSASIVDISGVDTAQLIYTVDGGSSIALSPTNISGNTYQFSIPQYAAGSLIAYHFYAVDSASPANTTTTPTYEYLSGNYIVYDNAVTDFVDSISSVSGAAVKISLPTGNQHITSVLIRNYTDNNRPNDSILVHIWSSVSNLPGVDLVPPRKVFPSATTTNTSPMTLIDFRADSAALDSVSGDIFIGYTVPSGGAWTCITQPGTTNRSFKLGTTGWAAATGTSGASDFHFRCVTEPSYVAPPTPPTASFTFDTTYTPSVMFSSTSTGTISSSLWTFGDGGTSTNANTNHTYTANGTYQVCLKVTNSVGTDSICQNVVINSLNSPTASFTYDTAATPNIAFSSTSTGTISSSFWTFGDGGSSTNPSTSHTYTTNGTYQVCLKVTNSIGSDSICQNVVISSLNPPTASFTFDTTNLPTVVFADASSGNPTQWAWDFGYNSQVSALQNPTHIFTAIGTYHVCLIATNTYGSSTSSCEDIYVSTVGIDNAFGATNIKIFPNPMIDKTRIEFANISKHNLILKVLDITGKQMDIDYIVYDNYIELKGTNLATGNYFIKLIIDNKKEYNAKLIVN